MSRLLMAASLGVGMLFSGAAFAQSTMTAPNNSSDSKLNPATTPGMAATTSDSGNVDTGASSAAIGTGNTEKGDNSPATPGVAGTQGETGANASNPGGVPKSSTT
jgi:hypothetical protein